MKKQHPKKNGLKLNKGPKHDKATHPNEKTTQHNDKDNKNKGKKTYRNCNFCDHDGHTESKCLKNMEVLETTMKKHNIHLDTSSASSSGQTLSTSIYALSKSGYALNVTCYYPSQEWVIDYGASYHMNKDKALFLALNNCNTKNIYVGDDRSLSVVGCKIVHLDNGQLRMYYVFLICPTVFYQCIE